jgi:hypothetical protein
MTQNIFDKLAEELVAGGNQGMSAKAHKKPYQVDPKQLAMGIKVEREHSDNPKVQKEIAMDHLTEHPLYYSGLKIMEDFLSKLETMKKAAGKIINLTRQNTQTRKEVLENTARDLRESRMDAPPVITGEQPG